MIDRYPGYEGYLDAHLDLGRALLKLDDPVRATPLLEYYVSSTSTQLEGLRARIPLGEALLKRGKYNEAILDAGEIEKAPKATPEILANALLLKARALIGLERDSRAQDSLNSAKAVAKERLQNSPLILGEASAIELDLKARECSRFPTERRLDEEKTIDQLSRRGTCLLEALNIYKDALNSGRSSAALEATNRIELAFDSYHHACLNPPEPPALHPFDRNQTQKARYREELGAVLEQECKKRYNEAKGILLGWKGSLPKETASGVDELLKTLPE